MNSHNNDGKDRTDKGQDVDARRGENYKIWFKISGDSLSIY